MKLIILGIILIEFEGIATEHYGKSSQGKEGVFPQHSVAMHSHLIKIIHTVISFLLWKALETCRYPLPALVFLR